MKPLSEDWREILCAEPAQPIFSARGLHMAPEGDWAELEYGCCRHPDSRIRSLLIRMGRRWTERPGAPLPQLFSEKADLRAAYRLLSSERVSMQDILEPHQARMAERCEVEPVVLAVQDTTMLNYSGLKATGGLVSIGGGGNGSKGLAAHFGLAVNPAGRALGVFNLDADFRLTEDEKSAGATKDGTDTNESLRWLKTFDRAQELARVCPKTRVITVCDREGDIWELLRTAANGGGRLLVRSSRSTQRRVRIASGRAVDLHKHVAKQPVLARATIDIKGCGGPRQRKPREARLSVRACVVDILPPGKSRNQETIRMLAVSATETRPPKGAAEPLHWCLLTTEGTPDAKSAVQALAWYKNRWSIETWFDTLKNGTRIKDRRLDHADDLRKCLAFDAITACQIHDLAFLGRDKPDMPADQAVAPDMIDCLYEHLEIIGLKNVRPPPDTVQTIKKFVVDLARVAGFFPRNAQPLPGTRKLWQAFALFMPVLLHFRGLRLRNQTVF